MPQDRQARTERDHKGHLRSGRRSPSCADCQAGRQRPRRDRGSRGRVEGRLRKPAPTIARSPAEAGGRRSAHTNPTRPRSGRGHGVRRRRDRERLAREQQQPGSGRRADRCHFAGSRRVCAAPRTSRSGCGSAPAIVSARGRARCSRGRGRAGGRRRRIEPDRGGEAVEYGQELIRIELPENSRVLKSTARTAKRPQFSGKRDVQQDPDRQQGEIALRILRACRTMGVGAVVAYSEADRDSLAAQLADEAICIGRRTPAQLSLRAGRDLGRGRDRLRRDPPRVWVPVRGRGFCRRGSGPRPRVHRSSAEVLNASPPRRQLARARAHVCARSRLRHAPRRGPRPRGGRAHRLPGADQALRGRRRQGMRLVKPRKNRIDLQDLPLRGQGRFGDDSLYMEKYLDESAISRSRSRSTASGTPSTWANETAPSSAATRRSSKRRRARLSRGRPSGALLAPSGPSPMPL